jgi:hypothetical protein
MVTIQQITKDAPSTKTCKREPSHPYEVNRTEKNQKVLPQTQIKPDISYATALKSQQNQYQAATPQNYQQNNISAETANAD